MPLARIRSFDPEAIAFLAAQLAQSGYTLQFVRPDETGLEEADLELTVVRRDLDQALLTAQAEAERLGVDVTVVPGVMPVAAPELAVVPEVGKPQPILGIADPIAEFTDIPEPASFPIDVKMPAAIEATAATDEIPDFTAEKSRWSQVAKGSSEKTAQVLGRGLGKAVDGIEAISDSVGRGLAGGKENLSEIGGSTVNRLNEWKVRFLTARALRRQARHPKTATFSAKPTLPGNSRRPKPLWLRERIYKGTAVAAVLATAAIIGWTLAGYAGSPNPVGKGTGLSTVQEQVPFGPASANAPLTSASTVPASVKNTAKPKPAVLTHATRAIRSYSDDDREVVVRHFDQKPANEQAKAKNRDLTRDGVKIISEE